MFYTTKAQSLKRLKSQILDVSSIRSSLISFSWHLRKEKSRAVNIFLIFYRCLRKGLSEEKRAPISVQIIDLRNISTIKQNPNPLLLYTMPNLMDADHHQASRSAYKFHFRLHTPQFHTVNKNPYIS